MDMVDYSIVLTVSEILGDYGISVKESYYSYPSSLLELVKEEPEGASKEDVDLIVLELKLVNIISEANEALQALKSIVASK